MIDVRAATEDDMVLAFLRGDIETKDPVRSDLYAQVLATLRADKAALIHRGDVHDPQQNRARRMVLSIRGYPHSALFQGFPGDTSWRMFKQTPDEVAGFKYANHLPDWSRLSGGTRLVADGVKNLDKAENAMIKEKVDGIVARFRQGEIFPPLIAVQCGTGVSDVVLMEGHHRATAYGSEDLLDEIEVIIGTSAQMRGWTFF
jgi:hypothetical protein